MDTESTPDPMITQLRREISEIDRAIVELVNKRLRLVARLKDYKESKGIGFVDPDREQWMQRFLHRSNGGPLSADGLDELFRELLDLTKRELAGR
jgi:chorismate mutase/prephenate dehydratase